MRGVGLWLVWACVVAAGLGLDRPVRADPEPAPAPAAPPNTTIIGDRRYQVDGVTFKIWRSRDGLGQYLGQTRLPWQSPQAPIVRGRAAYVWLPHRGLAVVDIGLSRFPYVVWQLLPNYAVKRARLEGDRLHVQTDRGSFEYDLTDPLSPQGPERYPAAPRRLYPADAQPISDGTWQDLGVLASSTGRRVYLYDGDPLVGTWLRSTAETLTVSIAGQPRVLARADVRHIEPVELALEMPPGPDKTAAAAKPSPPTPGRILLITGATIIAISQILAFTAIIVIVVVLPASGFRVPTGPYGAEPLPTAGSALHPPILAPQQLPLSTPRPLLNIRF